LILSSGGTRLLGKTHHLSFYEVSGGCAVQNLQSQSAKSILPEHLYKRDRQMVKRRRPLALVLQKAQNTWIDPKLCPDSSQTRTQQPHTN
jgi:hypothetical protein